MMPIVITGFEQLSSSICCRIMAGQSLPWKSKLCLFWKVLNWPKTGFLTHNFSYSHASKSIQGSIDADFDIVFNKTLSQ